MIKKYNKMMITIISLLNGLSFNLNACMITFINDTNQAIILYDMKDTNNKNSALPKVFTAMSTKGKSHRFGNNATHAHFAIYIKQPKNKNFTLTYEVKQNQCGTRGNPQIRLSDLENNSGDASLFTIIKNKKPHTSMVGRLPMIEKPEVHKNDTHSGCSSCAGQ